MRLSGLASSILPALFLASALQAQTAIPRGEPAASGLTVSVVDRSGAVMPGALVSIISLSTKEVRALRTDQAGKASAPLSPGKYTVKVQVEGFAVKQADIELPAGRANPVAMKITLDVITTESPVPKGAPDPARNPAAVVVEVTEHDDIGFHARLNSEATKGNRLLAIIPLENEKSLLVFSPAGGTPRPAYLVLSVNGVPAAGDLKTRIDLQPGKVFVGIHRLSQNSYLMVFRDESR